MAKIDVQGKIISVVQFDKQDFISLTDMIKAKDGDFFISDWLRNRNTVEYLGIWESVYNLTFNYDEFAIIKSKAGLNIYRLSILAKPKINSVKQSCHHPNEIFN